MNVPVSSLGRLAFQSRQLGQADRELMFLSIGETMAPLEIGHASPHGAPIAPLRRDDRFTGVEVGRVRVYGFQSAYFRQDLSQSRKSNGCSPPSATDP